MITGLITVNEKQVLEVNQDPTINATPSPVGSIAMFNDLGVGKFYVKIGALDTDWAIVQANNAESWLLGGNILAAPAQFGSQNDFDVEFIRNNIQFMRFGENASLAVPNVIEMKNFLFLDNQITKNAAMVLIGDNALGQSVSMDVNVTNLGVYNILSSNLNMNIQSNQSLAVTGDQSLLLSSNVEIFISLQDTAVTLLLGQFFADPNEGSTITNFLEFIGTNQFSFIEDGFDRVTTVDDTPLTLPILRGDLAIGDQAYFSVTANVVNTTTDTRAVIKKSTRLSNKAGIESVGIIQNDYTDIEAGLEGIDFEFFVDVDNKVKIRAIGLAATNLTWAFTGISEGLGNNDI